MEMENLFNAEATPEVEETPKAEKPANEKAAHMKELLKETVATDPTYVERVRKLSDKFEVVNSLGYGDSGNIVVDKSSAERRLAPTSKIVGYRVKNNSEETIKVQSETWAEGADGIWTGTRVEKAVAPGECFDVTRAQMTQFASAPEISFQFANGKMVRGSGGKKGGIKEELEAYYFSFDREEGKMVKQINDDEIKLNVAAKVGDKWVVKPEFADVFGYLNNPKAGGKAAKRSSGSKIKWNAQDAAANYIQDMLKKNGI